MAILEVNLEKPALIEEYQYPGESSGRSKSSSNQSSSGGGKGKLFAVLAVVAVVGMLAMKMKSSGKGGEAKHSGGDQEEYEHGPDPEIGGDKKYEVKRKVKSKFTGILGIAVAVVGLAVAAWKRRN
jgi:hypothetical protein